MKMIVQSQILFEKIAFFVYDIKQMKLYFNMQIIIISFKSRGNYSKVFASHYTWSKY